MKIDLHNFELYRFKVGPFFETQCMYVCKCGMIAASLCRWIVLVLRQNSIWETVFTGQKTQPTVSKEHIVHR